MSTAIMQQNTMYEFGESLIKNGLSPDHSQSGLSPLGSSQMRFTLSRMASSPMVGQASSNQLAAMLLGNLTQQHNHHNNNHNHHHHHRRLERTQSAPAPPVTSTPAASLTAATATVNTSRYKTELCRPFEEFGVCKYGDKCQFAHGIGELRSLARHPKYKTELCRTYHTVGFCPYGPRCHFVHNQEEAAAAAAAAQSQSKGQLGGNRASSGQARPAALSPSLSLDSPSPPCSLSQSPTSSMGSFFSEPELHSPGVDDQRLPVFNKLLERQIMSFSDLML
ncbi:unnamed protein product [Phyllotreta striolata]|uniref:C3H1-type domain-containing protein n=1 Tax=Phyllotreta striolata TaxID=444603 RepID=A0A9N9TK27_PHYSR|nr:unnamed protein product [Phyllotreta striolata]